MRLRLPAGILLLVASACAQAPGAPTVTPPGTTVSPVNVNRGTLGVSPGTALFQPGQVEHFAALPQQIFTGVTTTVTWSVDDTAVATVDSSGNLTAIGPGFTWLRANGAAGDAAHPISVSSTAAIAATGASRLSSCSGPLTSCSQIMKSAGSNGSFSFSYRHHGSFVVAEFLTSNRKDHAALVGVVSASGGFAFTTRAWIAPVLSLGAGGCCEALSDFVVSVEGASPVSGSFTTSGTTSGSVTLHYQIVKP